MRDKCHEDNVATHGATWAAWEMVSEWLAEYRAAHPDDDRSDLELLEELGGECATPA